jgi:hypothetical protein
MKRPLTDRTAALFCAIFLLAAIINSPATGYNDRTAGNDGILEIVCEITADCGGPAVTAFEIAVPDTDFALESVRSSLRTGIAVGKCVAGKARLVAGSLALAAHHGARALVRSSLRVF